MQCKESQERESRRTVGSRKISSLFLRVYANHSSVGNERTVEENTFEPAKRKRDDEIRE